MKGHRRENVCHEPRRPQGSQTSLRWWLRLGEFDNDVAGFGQAEFVASDGLDFVRIGSQRFHFVGEFGIFPVEANNLPLDTLDFGFGAAHGKKAMCAEDVVQKQREYAKNQNGASILRPQDSKFRLLWWHS